MPASVRVFLVMFLIGLGCIYGYTQQGTWGMYRRAPQPFAHNGVYPSHDMWGHKFPIACRKDLSWVPATVLYEELHNDRDRHGHRYLGYWTPYLGYKDWGKIVLSSDVDDITLTHVLHHERCHAVMYQLTGDGQWHDH